MKKLIILGILSFASISFATVKEEVIPPVHHLSGEIDICYNKYDTLEDEMVKVKMEGVQYGAKFRYELFKPNYLYTETSVIHSQGPVYWKIKDVIGGDSIKSSIKTYRTHGTSRIGYTFLVNAFTFTPYIGTGWNHNQGDASKLDLLYMPVGMKVTYAAIDNLLTVGVKGEMLKYLHLWQSNPDFKISANLFLEKEYGYEFSLPIVFHGTYAKDDACWKSSVEPYVCRMADNILSMGARISAVRGF